MNNKIIGACKPALFGFLAVGLIQPALATSVLSLSVGAGLESHDNAARVDNDEESDLKRIIDAEVGYQKTDGALLVDLNYGAAYGDYQDDVDEDETAIDGRADVNWRISPGRLHALLNHQISQQMSDRRGQDVANNREQRSVLTGGFDGFLRLGAVDTVILRPRISDIRFDESENSDSQRAGLAVMWEHRLNSVSAFDLTANYDKVTFDEDEEDYDATGAMLSYRTTLSRLSYQIGAGANRINRDTADDVNGSNILAAIDYAGDEGQDWGASYVHQLTDSSIGLSGVELGLDNFTANDSNFAEVDIVEIDKFDAYWRNRFSVTSLLSLGVGYQKQNYEDTPQDQKLAYVQAGYQYTINSRWSTGIDGRFERTKFTDVPQEEYDGTRVYLNATYRPIQPLEIRFSVGQEKRDSDIAANSYTDNVALISFRYRVY